MEKIFKNIPVIFSRKSFIKLVFGLFALMILLADFGKKYQAERVAECVFFLLVVFVLSPAVVKVWVSVWEIKQACEYVFLSISLKFQNISKEKYESLLGPKLLREML